MRTYVLTSLFPKTLAHLDSWWLVLTHFDVLAKAVTLAIRVLIQNLASLSNLFPDLSHSSFSSYPLALRLNVILCKLSASGTDTEVMACKP